MIPVLLLSLAALSCQDFGEALQAVEMGDASRPSQERLALLMDICTESLDADTLQQLQLTRCLIESRKRGAGVRCNFFLYGDRRLPFEPMKP